MKNHKLAIILLSLCNLADWCRRSGTTATLYCTLSAFLIFISLLCVSFFSLSQISCVTGNAIQSFGYGSEGGTLLVTEPPSSILPPAQPLIISKPAPSLHGNAIKPMDSACMFSTCANLQVSFFFFFKYILNNGSIEVFSNIHILVSTVAI